MGAEVEMSLSEKLDCFEQSLNELKEQAREIREDIRATGVDHRFESIKEEVTEFVKRQPSLISGADDVKELESDTGRMYEMVTTERNNSEFRDFEKYNELLTKLDKDVHERRKLC